MTVGNGSTSDSATALMTSLNQDSGYGGSIADESAMEEDSNAAWRAGLMEDRPTPAHTPTRPGEWNPAGEWIYSLRRAQNSSDFG
jgi:mitofusin